MLHCHFVEHVALDGFEASPFLVGLLRLGIYARHQTVREHNLPLQDDAGEHCRSPHRVTAKRSRGFMLDGVERLRLDIRGDLC